MKSTDHPLLRWKAAQPKITRSCLHCGGDYVNQFESKYCSSRCKTAHWRAKNLVKPTLLCDFCSEPIQRDSIKRKFCCVEHKWRFYGRVRAGRPIDVKVDATTIIQTKDYKNIAQVRETWQQRLGSY